MAYVGATGRNLLGNQAYIEPDTRILDRRVTLTENSSNYARLPEVVRNWTISGVFHARSGFPIDVLDSEQPLGQGFVNAGRPDLVPGVPIWIDDSSVAGHRRLNPAACSEPASGLAGTPGRNQDPGSRKSDHHPF